MDDIKQRFERFRASEMEQEARIQQALDETLPRQIDACVRAVALLRARELLEGLNDTVMDGRGTVDANDGVFDEQNAKMAVAALSLLWERQDKVGFSRFERRFNRLVIYAHGERIFVHTANTEKQDAWDPDVVHCGLSLRISSGHAYPDLWETVTQLPYRLNQTTGEFNHTYDLHLNDVQDVAAVRDGLTDDVFRILETKRYLFTVAEGR